MCTALLEVEYKWTKYAGEGSHSLKRLKAFWVCWGFNNSCIKLNNYPAVGIIFHIKKMAWGFFFFVFFYHRPFLKPFNKASHVRSRAAEANTQHGRPVCVVQKLLKATETSACQLLSKHQEHNGSLSGLGCISLQNTELVNAKSRLLQS